MKVSTLKEALNYVDEFGYQELVELDNNKKVYIMNGDDLLWHNTEDGIFIFEKE